jgi:hypothetical protein
VVRRAASRNASGVQNSANRLNASKPSRTQAQHRLFDEQAEHRADQRRVLQPGVAVVLRQAAVQGEAVIAISTAAST